MKRHERGLLVLDSLEGMPTQVYQHQSRECDAVLQISDCSLEANERVALDSTTLLAHRKPIIFQQTMEVGTGPSSGISPTAFSVSRPIRPLSHAMGGGRFGKHLEVLFL